jgi:GT2 family glycosyltransferase
MILFPKVTILMTSIGREPYVTEAINSVLGQTKQDFELVIVDSGKLKGNWKEFKKITLCYTGESEGMNKEVCMVSKVFNEAYKAGLIRGKYFCTFYDDDIYYPEFIEKMAGYLDEHPEADAVRCSEARTEIHRNQTTNPTPPLIANDFISGQNFDCVVDGMQTMIRTSVLAKVKEKYGDILLPETLNTCSHSDGIFLNRVGEVIDKMHFITDTLCEHRATPLSTYTPTL